MDEVGRLTGYNMAKKRLGYLVAIKILGGIPGRNYGASGGCDCMSYVRSMGSGVIIRACSLPLVGTFILSVS